jgi:hypothetical protein
MGGRRQHQHDLAWTGDTAGLSAMPAVEGSSSLLRTSLGQAINEGRLIPAGDHHVRLYEEGAGLPVVVIIAGAGDCADSWVPIRHRLAAVHRVVSYDRAAIGGSDQAAPATAERYLAELDAVIWVSWQREIATLSAKGSFSFTGTKSHNIHLRHAGAVTAAVGEIASPAGSNRPRQETPRY